MIDLEKEISIIHCEIREAHKMETRLANTLAICLLLIPVFLFLIASHIAGSIPLLIVDAVVIGGLIEYLDNAEISEKSFKFNNKIDTLRFQEQRKRETMDIMAICEPEVDQQLYSECCLEISSINALLRQTLQEN